MGFNSRLEIIKQRVTELENIFIDITQSEEQREKNVEKNEQSLRYFGDKIKTINISN